MEHNTIVRNTPISSKKASFFKALASFFNATIDFTSEIQCEIADRISDFEEGHYLKTYDLNNITIFDKEVVRKMTPTHNRKKALYSALVTFMDDALAVKKEVEKEHGDDEEGATEEILAYAYQFFPKTFGTILAGVVVTHDKEEEEEEEPSKKNYNVKVKICKEVTYSVAADSEEEAKTKAKVKANMDYYNMDNYDVLSVNVEE